MRDLALLTILLAFSAFALYRPWLGLLGLAFVGFMHPQGYAVGFMRHFPIYLVLFGMVGAGLAYQVWRDKSWASLPWRRLLDWRVLGLAALWLWFAVTSYFALLPWEAWAKYVQVLKILPPLVLTLLLIDTREKLFYLLATLALAILLVALKGGYWSLMTGFHDRVYGPPGSAYGDNNSFAVAVSMAIPLLALWVREARDRVLRAVLLGGIVLCYGAVLSSWSRGGMLSLGLVTLLLIWHSKHKLLVIPAFAVLAGVLFTQLPQEWFGRMETATAYQTDESAQGRITVWKIGLDLAEKRPLTGGGFNAWPAVNEAVGGGLDWHSAYVEMLAEHGYVGLVLWLGLLLPTVLSLAWIGRRGDWVANYAAMLQASLLAYLAGSITLGIAYWELPYHLVAISVLLGGFARPVGTMRAENTHRAST